MQIRHATLEDSQVLQSLLSQMGDPYQRTLEEIEDRVRQFQKPGHQLWVAVMDHRVVGMIAFGCYEQFRLQGCCCHIDTLVIDKRVRGQGIGKALLKEAEAYALKHDVREIELTTANYRRSHGTHAFYHRLGYQDHDEIDCTYFAKQHL